MPSGIKSGGQVVDAETESRLKVCKSCPDDASINLYVDGGLPPPPPAWAMICRPSGDKEKKPPAAVIDLARVILGR
ncbi:MAG TPA: hypothetical protein VMG09_01940 [Bacteroidota bacterium]|nr:hypothetical protein [Bacteroidota bacterium]